MGARPFQIDASTRRAPPAGVKALIGRQVVHSNARKLRRRSLLRTSGADYLVDRPPTFGSVHRK